MLLLELLAPTVVIPTVSAVAPTMSVTAARRQNPFICLPLWSALMLTGLCDGAGRLSSGSERGEALEAGDTFARRADGGERLARFFVPWVGLEVLVADDPGVPDGEERPVLQLSLLQAHAGVFLDHLERCARGREEQLVLAGAEPEWAADAARREHRAGLALVQPGRGHGAEQRLEGDGLVPGVGRQGEDRFRVDRHPRLGAGAVDRGQELVVVDDDAAAGPDHRPVPHRVVVGRDGRVGLRLFAHM